jgi:hypothetical protein
VLTLVIAAKSADGEIKSSFSRNLWHQSIVMVAENVSYCFPQSAMTRRPCPHSLMHWRIFVSFAGDPFHLLARVRSH